MIASRHFLSTVARTLIHHNFPFLFALALFTIPARAQTSPPQRVYGSTTASPTSVAGFAKNPTTGALTAISGSSFAERFEGGRLAVDGQGKFLFVLNPTTNDISMFAINPTSGALTEVPASPFAVPTAFAPGTDPPTNPLAITAEPSGKFLFVSFLYAQGSTSPNGIVASLAIDTSGPSPALTPVEAAIPPAFPSGDGAPIKLLTDSTGLHLYVGVGVGYGPLVGGADVYSIDPSGHLTFQGAAASLASYGTDYAIDPQNRFFYAVGGSAHFIVACAISPLDGTATTCSTQQNLGFLPSSAEMQVESSGHFLYIPTSTDMAVFSIDQTTGVPTQVTTVTGVFAGSGHFVTDPLGPYLYTTDNLNPGNIHTYQIDLTTGGLTQISGSPVTIATQCCQSLAISGTLPVPVSGPSAVFSPTSASPFTATAGASGPTQTFSIINNGNQSLTFTSISITGSDAASFSQTNTCTSPLAPNANCTVTISFSPATAANFSANVQLVDNAASSPQTLALAGTGIAPAPTVSLSSTILSFSDTAQGATAGPSPITVTNTGTGPLHISVITLAGPNPGDFSQTNTCTAAAIAPTATCTINITFTPVASGGRTATLTITDDASGSPHTVSLQGTGTAPFQLAPNSSSSGGTTAAVTAGQTAQYPLQLTPGSGFTGTVSLACTGAPTAASCSVSPASLNITNATPVPFTVSITTSASAAAMSMHSSIFPTAPIYLAIVGCMLFLWLLRFHKTSRFSQAAPYASVLALFMFVLAAFGCGGSTTKPPPPVTPKGTYAITVSATATNLPPQTINLTLIVN